MLPAPTGLWEEVYPCFTSVKVWDTVCASSEGSAMMLPHPPLPFSLSFCLAPSLLSPALDFQLMALWMLWGVDCTLVCPLPFFCKYFGLWGECKRPRGEQMRSEKEKWERSGWWAAVWETEWKGSKKRQKREMLFFKVVQFAETRRRVSRKRGKEQSAFLFSSLVRFPVNHHARPQQ